MSPAEALDTADRRPRVVVVGGGFAGLAAIKALRKAPVRILLIDRRNYHLFQPLLYQVATAMLPPSDIAVPIRGALRKQRNATVVMAEVTGVDPERRRVLAAVPDRDEAALPYDYLILATGVDQSYFGHDEFAPFAPGLKSIEDAQSIRSKLLR
ncbi:MAG TPA: FAD-dependent oxidoreductase, partial [Candidatus Methylomirabilis sp.]|nr:FAD-dependent oxidoreductase [Candidatus Methylomirabilis sp.]